MILKAPQFHRKFSKEIITLKDVLISHSKITSVRHLLIKFMFPYRNLSGAKQIIYPSVLRIMWLSVDNIVETEEVWVQKSISVSY